MIEGHIFIQGVISPWQDNAAEEWGEVNIKQVTQQIQDNAEAEKLIVHIHSPGGDVDEGFGIHDILVASGKEIETRIEGLCASIATVIALAGSTRLMTENSEFMIHNPWGDAWGDADELQKYTDMVKAAEEKVINFYADKTGGDREILDQMMKEETWMSAEKAQELGFITGVIVTTKAVAKIRNTNQQNNLVMNKQELEKSIEKGHNSLIEKIKAILKGNKATNMLTTTTADGTVLDFGDQVEAPEEIAVGMTATIEGGGTPDGEFAMPDGSTWVFEAGTLTAMNPAEGGDEDEEMEALKQENEDLKQQLADAQASAKATETAVEALQEEVKNFKSQVKSDLEGFGPDGVPKTENKGERKALGKPITGV